MTEPNAAVTTSNAETTPTGGLMPAIAVQQRDIPGKGFAKTQPLGFGRRQGEIKHIGIDDGIVSKLPEQG